MPRKIALLICVFAFSFLGCADPGSDGSDAGSPITPVRATAAPLNTLVPTFTPLPDVSLMPTPTSGPGRPQTTADPTPTINFDQPVVQLVYRIPALGLDRELEGNVSSQIAVIDQTIPLGMQRSNQGGVLLELQSELPQIELQPVPAGCDSCVYFQYTLPLEQESREGWLQDPVVLASIENYMTTLVGPHFPPDTVVGLRRGATFYYPAHSIALMSDGRVYTWLATEPQITEPYTTSIDFAGTLANLPLAELSDAYVVTCLPEPMETMRIYTTGETLDITIHCPAYALPTTLLPLYAQLDQLLAEKLATYEGPPRPPTGIPLETVLDYKRLDGNRLTLLQNGRVTIQNNGQIIYTGTMTTTEVLSLTTDLLNSGQLRPGLTTLIEPEPTSSATTAAETPEASPTPERPASFLLVRGPQGMLDGKFEAIDVPVLNSLNALLDSLLAPPESAETPTPAAEDGAAIASPTATSTPTPSP